MVTPKYLKAIKSLAWGIGLIGLYFALKFSDFRLSWLLFPSTSMIDSVGLGDEYHQQIMDEKSSVAYQIFGMIILPLGIFNIVIGIKNLIKKDN